MIKSRSLSRLNSFSAYSDTSEISSISEEKIGDIFLIDSSYSLPLNIL